MNPNAALSTATRPQIIGAMKAANSTDPDVLLHVKEDLLDRRKCKRNMATVESAYDEYLGTLGIPRLASAPAPAVSA
jgi:hypothetical protein